MIQITYNQIFINQKKMLNGLNSLKSKVDKLDVDKQKAVPVDLKKIK